MFNNNKSENVLVAKFGGTSVGTSERIISVVEIIVNLVKKQSKKLGEKSNSDNGSKDISSMLVAVVSAMSSKNKKEGTTTRLLRACTDATKGQNYRQDISDLTVHHTETLDELYGRLSELLQSRKALKNSDSNDDEFFTSLEKELNLRYKECYNKVNKELHKLSSLLEALSIVGELSARSIDVVLSFGERLSSIILTFAVGSYCCVYRNFSTKEGIEEKDITNSLSVSCLDLSQVYHSNIHFTDSQFITTLQTQLSSIFTNIISPPPSPSISPSPSLSSSLHLFPNKTSNPIWIPFSNGEEMSESQTNLNIKKDSKNNSKNKKEKSKNHIVIATGFFGLVPGGILNYVGRGYSDYTAALVARCLNSHELQIWKEVDGIFSADPRKVKGSKLLPELSPAEAAELTYFGSEVIHPFTMELAIAAEIPIRITNILNPSGQGTVIVPHSSRSVPRNSSLSLSSLPSLETVATAITTKSPVSILNVNSNRMLRSPTFLAEFFSILRKYDIVVDLVSTSEVNISLTLPPLDAIGSEEGEKMETLIKELSSIGTVSLVHNRSIVSLVGEGMDVFKELQVHFLVFFQKIKSILK